MLFDSHVHSAASPDSEMPPEEIIAHFSSKGMGFIFTEHLDYNPQGERYFSVDLDHYPADYLQYKSDSVGVGLELNLLAESVEQNRAHAADRRLDYVIGSVHWIDGWDIYFAKDIFAQFGEGVYERYLAYALKMVETNEYFDALGHIDYISRYSPLPEKNVRYKKYADAYDNLLRALVERDKLLELNTARLGREDARRNITDIYSRYRDLGGRYVTIGSDAHVPERLANNFDIALDIINGIGLVPVYFKERRMILC